MRGPRIGRGETPSFVLIRLLPPIVPRSFLLNAGIRLSLPILPSPFVEAWQRRRHGGGDTLGLVESTREKVKWGRIEGE